MHTIETLLIQYCTVCLGKLKCWEVARLERSQFLSDLSDFFFSLYIEEAELYWVILTDHWGYEI